MYPAFRNPLNFAYANIVSSPLKVLNKKGRSPVIPSIYQAGGAKVVLNLQISHLKLKVYLKRYPTLRISSNLAQAFIVKSPLNI